jgi:hypothetical protein
MQRYWSRRLPLLKKALEEVDGAGGGASVDLETTLGGLRGFLAASGILEEGVEGFLEFAGIGDLGCSASAEEGGGEGGEVLHVGAEDDGCAGGDGFGWVLSASGHEAFSDEDDGGAAIPTRQLAGGIHKQGVGVFHHAGFGAAGEAEPDLLELVGDGIGSLLMAGDEDEEEVRMGFAKAEEDFGQKQFLAVEGAAAETHGGVRGNAE